MQAFFVVPCSHVLCLGAVKRQRLLVIPPRPLAQLLPASPPPPAIQAAAQSQEVAQQCSSEEVVLPEDLLNETIDLDDLISQMEAPPKDSQWPEDNLYQVRTECLIMKQLACYRAAAHSLQAAFSCDAFLVFPAKALYMQS